MPCSKWHIQISKWHEGELNEEGEAALLRHLETCRYCRSLEARLRAVSGLLVESHELPVPDFLAQKITASVSEKMRDRSGLGITSLIDLLLYRHRVAFNTGILVIALCIGGVAGYRLNGYAKVVSEIPSYDLLTMGGIRADSQSTTLNLIWQENGEGVGR
jgi:hypothetical protein